MDFSLRQLRVFATLAATEHFGRAAELLRLSQPTVSADIRALERAVGLQLFTRSRAGTTLTDAGSALLPHADDVLARSDDFAEQAAQLGQEPQHVRLAATPSVINYLVPAVLNALNTSPSGVQVSVVEVSTGGLEEKLAAGEADLGVGHFVHASSSTERARIAHDEVCVLTARGDIDPTLPINLHALRDRNLLIWPREQHPDYFDALLAACRERGLDPNIVESTSALSGAQSYLLRNGQAFSLVPFDFAREASPSMAFAALEPPLCIPLDAIWHRPASPAVAHILSTLRRVRKGTVRHARQAT